MGELITFDKAMGLAGNVPGVQVNREAFLCSKLSKIATQDQIDKAIHIRPAAAGLTIDMIRPIAEDCISAERLKATSASFAAGLPGNPFAAIPLALADGTQYFAFMLRTMQELAYLYGWNDLHDENGIFDETAKNKLMILTGCMFGVQGANVAVTKVSQMMAATAGKKIAQQALTKGALYPIVKKIAGILGVKMTKQIFGKTISKSIPFIGGFVGGTITYASFGPMAHQLVKELEKTDLAKVDHIEILDNVD